MIKRLLFIFLAIAGSAFGQGLKFGAYPAMSTYADGDLLLMVDLSDTTDDPTGSTKHATFTSLSGAVLAYFNTLGPTVSVAKGGTGAATLTDGGVLLGSGTGAITPMGVLADGAMIVGDGTTDPVAESGATLRTSIGVGTGDSPQFTGIELGHATDTTLTRTAAGAVAIEGVAMATQTYVDAADTVLSDALADQDTAAEVGAVPFHDAAVDPTVNDDVTLYTEGTLWRNNQGTASEADDTYFRLGDDTDGAAVWAPEPRLSAAGAFAVSTLVATDLNVTNPFQTDTWIIAASDETTALTTGTAKVTFLAPYAATITAIEASVTTAPTDASLIVDVNEAGTSLMTTNKCVIETAETSTLTATTPPGETDTAVAQWAVITIDIDQIGSTVAGAGLKIYIEHIH